MGVLRILGLGSGYCCVLRRDLRGGLLKTRINLLARRLCPAAQSDSDVGFGKLMNWQDTQTES